jgi:hypothetical protein
MCHSACKMLASAAKDAAGNLSLRKRLKFRIVRR